MPLNIGGRGVGKPYVKYSAKADKWFVRGSDGGDVEIQRPTFLVDFDNIATGWLRFREGQAPERMMDPSLDRTAPSPGDGFKRSFVVNTHSRAIFGGIAEFASASTHVGDAMNELYRTYETERGQRSSKLPVVACVGAQQMKDRFGINYQPRFEILDWLDRPPDLPDDSPVEVSEVWTPEADLLSNATASGRPATWPPPTAFAPPTAEVEF
jgi:hypothetical protein